MNANEVIDSLVRCTAGQIVACNVLAGVEHQLLDPAWVKETLALLGRIGNHVDYATPEKLVKALEDLQTGQVSPRSVPTSALPDIRLRGDATPSQFQVEVSCVLPLHVLRQIMFSEDKLRLRREGLAMPLSAASFNARATFNEWQSKPARVRTVRINPGKSLGRGRSVVWFTRRDALKRADATGDANDRAKRTRNKLGLVHHAADTTLVALHFPPATLSGVASARPTFADAARHRRFKTWPDGAGARRRRQWGTTVDLEALNAGAASVDGWPERVTKVIDGAALGTGRFEFELLGAVQAPLGTGEAADAAFATRLAGGRTTAQVAQTLKALLSKSDSNE